MKLYLVRHGRSAGNLPGRMTGWSEHSLTRLGTAQACRVAARLAPLGPMPVYSSDLPRALETARLIAARWASAQAATAQAATAETAIAGAETVPPGVVADRRLREIDLGDYEGRSWDELAADHELADAFTREPLATTLPGGESLAMVRERVLAAFEEILRGEHAVACLVTHDGPIRAILNHVLEIPAERHWAISTSHGGLSLLEAAESWISARFVNDTSHLAGLEADASADACATEVSAQVVEGSSERPAPDSSERRSGGLHAERTEGSTGE